MLNNLLQMPLKRVIQKIVEATGDLIANKVTDRILNLTNFTKE